jgi:hypothetical protein
MTAMTGFNFADNEVSSDDVNSGTSERSKPFCFIKNMILEIFDDALSFALKKYRGQIFSEHDYV